MSRVSTYPRVRVVLREAWASALRARVPSVLVATLVAAVCTTTLLTVGRAEAAEAQVAARMDSAGARDLRITDAASTYLTPSVLAQIAGVSIIERAVGLGLTVDAANTTLGPGAPARATYLVTAGLTDLCTRSHGRMALPGEAWVTEGAMASLGLPEPFGSVTTTQGASYPVVGSCVLREPYTELEGVVVNAPDAATTTVAVVTTSAEDSLRAQQEVLAIIGPHDPNELQVRSPVTLADVRGEVVGDLSAFGQGLLVLVLGAGTFLVAVAAALLGAVLSVVGTFGWLRWSSLPVSVEFATATGVLAVLAAGIGAVAPAVGAAWQDSVRVLRTP